MRVILGSNDYYYVWFNVCMCSIWWLYSHLILANFTLSLVMLDQWVRMSFSKVKLFCNVEVMNQIMYAI